MSEFAASKQVGVSQPCMSIGCNNNVYFITIVWACKQICMLIEDPVVSSACVTKVGNLQAAYSTCIQIHIHTHIQPQAAS